jgi:hypothetical protein
MSLANIISIGICYVLSVYLQLYLENSVDSG